MNSYKMQQDYSTRQQRKSPRLSQSSTKLKIKRLPSKFRQALFWMALGLIGGLIANYISNPKPVELASQQVDSKLSKPSDPEKSIQPEEERRVIQLELPAAS